MHDGGSDWSGWPSYLSFFRHVAELDLPEYQAWQHYEAAARNGASRIMHTRFWIVSDRHSGVHLDPQDRLHREDGPAREWADGWAIWAWHGIRVPADLITTGWPVDRILTEPNSEIRRCAVEITAARNGWRQMIAAAGWTQVGDTVPDPGNPGQDLSLWDIGDLYGQGERLHLLHMVNGTVERDGTRHEFGETVPGSITDPIAAAAWQIGLSADQYALTVRRT